MKRRILTRRRDGVRQRYWKNYGSARFWQKPSTATPLPGTAEDWEAIRKKVMAEVEPAILPTPIIGRWRTSRSRDSRYPDAVANTQTDIRKIGYRKPDMTYYDLDDEVDFANMDDGGEYE